MRTYIISIISWLIRMLVYLAMNRFVGDPSTVEKQKYYTLGYFVVRKGHPSSNETKMQDNI